MSRLPDQPQWCSDDPIHVVGQCPQCQRATSGFYFYDNGPTRPPYGTSAGMTVCRTCAAPVIWVKLPSGKRMPIDPEPSVKGNVTLITDTPNGAVVLTGTDLAVAVERGLELRTSHFATCPHADWHRRSQP